MCTDDVLGFDAGQHPGDAGADVATVGAWIGERSKDAQKLHNRAGVPVADDQWERTGLRGADVQEVDVLAVDDSGELWILVELRLPQAPVVFLLPVLG